MDIGNAVKMLRMKKGISQKDLSSMCGISANALCSIESGNTFPSKTQSQKCVRLWIFQILIYYCLAFQKKIFLKTRGFCIKHYVNL